MKRCGIERKDGVIRIGILCPDCAGRALAKLIAEGRRYWSRDYEGPESCEACLADETEVAN
jgi:hypothetical protein